MAQHPVDVHDIVFPTVFCQRLDWEICKWDLNDWTQNLSHDHFPLRIGELRCSKTPLWERTCKTQTMNAQEFFNSIKLESSPEKKWHYFDYKHIDEWFKENDYFKDLSWKCINSDISTPNGFTLWMGTTASHTPMHYDSYGFNLVGQVYGRKMWIMFPPDVSNLLRPTRVPYEESSVYSGFNMFCACGAIPDKVLEYARYVILEPGDVLFVPPHWWHYVESLSSSISINSWIPLKDNYDNINRLEESLVKSFICAFTRELPEEQKQLLLNPNEDLSSGISNLEIIKLVLESCKMNNQLQSTYQPTEVSEHETGNDPVLHKETTLGRKSSEVKGLHNSGSNMEKVPTVEVKVVKNWLSTKCGKNLPLVEQDEVIDSDVYTIVNSVCSPDIIRRIREKILSSSNSKMIKEK